MNKYELTITFTSNHEINPADLKIIDHDVEDGFEIIRPAFDEDHLVKIKNQKIINLIKK